MKARKASRCYRLHPTPAKSARVTMDQTRPTMA